ncbi:MAG: hypothetical protein KDH94_05600, partial [Coxiellaceae bacterium]|nr:hypothetical protein [Coxiellaceae bacterium]
MIGGLKYRYDLEAFDKLSFNAIKLVTRKFGDVLPDGSLPNDTIRCFILELDETRVESIYKEQLANARLHDKEKINRAQIESDTTLLFDIATYHVKPKGPWENQMRQSRLTYTHPLLDIVENCLLLLGRDNNKTATGYCEVPCSAIDLMLREDTASLESVTQTIDSITDDSNPVEVESVINSAPSQVKKEARHFISRHKELMKIESIRLGKVIGDANGLCVELVGGGTVSVGVKVGAAAALTVGITVPLAPGALGAAAATAAYALPVAAILVTAHILHRNHMKHVATKLENNMKFANQGVDYINDTVAPLMNQLFVDYLQDKIDENTLFQKLHEQVSSVHEISRRNDHKMKRAQKHKQHSHATAYVAKNNDIKQLAEDVETQKNAVVMSNQVKQELERCADDTCDKIFELILALTLKSSLTPGEKLKLQGLTSSYISKAMTSGEVRHIKRIEQISDYSILPTFTMRALRTPNIPAPINFQGHRKQRFSNHHLAKAQ